MNHPVLNPALLLAPSDEGYVAYSPVLHRIYRLNPTAALIVELCDGQRTPETIQDLLGPVLTLEARAEIHPWIEQALEAGVLLGDAAASSSSPPLSADELVALAEELRDRGSLLPAFVCQLRASELAGDDSSVWFQLGELAQIVGRREDSLRAYEKYLESQPEDVEAQHIVTALRGDELPIRASDDYIQALYKRFSTFYDQNMCDELGYEGPEALRRAVHSVRPNISQASVLDLGCGTGLAGVQFRAYSDSLVGIDLSPEMVEIARGHNLYDKLEVCEITEWLNRCVEKFDLIIACDTFIYFGELDEILQAAASRLNPGGLLAFSLERSDLSPFRLGGSGRYGHHRDHVRRAGEAANLDVVLLQEGPLRMEYGEEVVGLFCCLEPSS